MATISQLNDNDVKSYVALAIGDAIQDGAIATALAHFGSANLTVCPSCGVDDFCHEEGCAVGVYVEGQV